eukprot:6212780-Pleurochrysis_carterae.AAC.1
MRSCVIVLFGTRGAYVLLNAAITELTGIFSLDEVSSTVHSLCDLSNGQYHWTSQPCFICVATRRLSGKGIWDTRPMSLLSPREAVVANQSGLSKYLHTANCACTLHVLAESNSLPRRCTMPRDSQLCDELLDAAGIYLAAPACPS